MDRMLVVVFENESDAYLGKEALMGLDGEGSIDVLAHAVVVKQADGTVKVKEGDDTAFLATLVGTSVGSLIGLLGGPVGVAMGATAGFTVGAAKAADDLSIGEDFIDDVSKQLQPGRVALVAQIGEDWITPLDSRMEALGGTVYRRSLADVREAIDEKEVAAMKADLAQMKAEQAEDRAGLKAKLQGKITQLESKIQARLQKAKDRRAAAERKDQEKVAALKAKAAEARAKVS
ncbi:MAG: DUF1269 domain-containing protein [Candidatus Eiseniibacteriota bacterium]